MSGIREIKKKIKVDSGEREKIRNGLKKFFNEIWRRQMIALKCILAEIRRLEYYPDKGFFEKRLRLKPIKTFDIMNNLYGIGYHSKKYSDSRKYGLSRIIYWYDEEDPSKLKWIDLELEYSVFIDLPIEEIESALGDFKSGAIEKEGYKIGEDKYGKYFIKEKKGGKHIICIEGVKNLHRYSIIFYHIFKIAENTYPDKIYPDIKQYRRSKWDNQKIKETIWLDGWWG
ncbi:hypothetical protein [Caldisericum sp.]|uniref:hypothetical protein n=1 Tax=Caldisericum sp. TaxID=2499687 RepID=UPI003D0D6EEE